MPAERLCCAVRSRRQLQPCLANLLACLVGLEACARAHHVGRQVAALGHDVRLLPAQYVKPLLKGAAALTLAV
jgi:transposase